VESRGKVNAVSPKGAIGPMQTMPKTLKDPGYGVVPARDNSVAELRRVGQDYIDAMYKKYGMKGGLAAYNWGPGNWERALKRAGGDVDRALASAPKETREYVPAVMSRL
jgi:soluble lytic murein transglycosylase-like protein